MRRLLSIFTVLVLTCLRTLPAANGGGTSQTDRFPSDLASAVIGNYCAIMHAAYGNSRVLARKMEASVGGFLAKPNFSTLEAARQSWIECRATYLQTEIGRFCDGPIEAVEGFINAWPIDENYIDYNVDDPAAGIINQPEQFPKISREILLAANEKGREKNISLGFHAIEFLLWGEDLSSDGPGKRPASDYEDGPVLRHADRRREYLRVAASLLVEHLQTVESAWQPDNPANYRARFLTLPASAALANIFVGVGTLSGAELGGERLLVPYATKEQEGEHSCFSDTTHLDFIYDQTGIQNIFLGCFTGGAGRRVAGPGLIALIESVDPKLASNIKKQIEESLGAFKSIPAPFDQAILGRDRDPGRIAIKRAIDAMQIQTVSIAKAAAALGIRVNLK